MNQAESLRAQDAGVAAVLDLTAEFSAPPGFRSLPYANIQVLDLTAPSPRQIDEALAFIAENAPRGRVYVHCKAGYSRSAVIAGAHLIHTGRAKSADHAIDLLRQARPGIVVRPEAVQAIRDFQPRTHPRA